MKPHNFLVSICFASAVVMLSSAPLFAQSVAVMVNGEPITNFDIEQRSKLTAASTRKAPTRQEVIDELIDEKIKIKEGKKFGIDPTAADIDQSFGTMSSRMRITPEQLAKTLEAQGIRTDTLRARIKADIVWGSLVRGRYKESLHVPEKDVQAALNSDGKSDAESFEYRMRPVVLIVPQGATALTDSRRKEAEALRERVQSCEDAENMFRVMQNATIRPTVVKTSADLPAPLREMLDKTPVGKLTPPEVTRQGIEMVALCGRNATTVDTPKKREIREKIYGEKYEARSKSYLRDIRRAAMIEYR